MRSYKSIFLLALWVSLGLKADLVAQGVDDSKGLGIKLGMLYCPSDPFHYWTGTVEKALGQRFSVQGSVGLNPFSVSDAKVYSRFFWHLSMEARYYFALRGPERLSGFFIGPLISTDRRYGFYRGQGGKAYRYYWNTIGLGIGYQHIFPKRIILDGGISVIFPDRLINERYDRAGKLLGRSVWPIRYNFYGFLRVGIRL